MSYITFNCNREDYDKKSLEIGMLVKRNLNNLNLNPFSYRFMNSCCRSLLVPYHNFSEEKESSPWEHLISVSFTISDWEYGRGYAKAIKKYISCPALYVVSTHAILDQYFYGNDPRFPKRWAEDKDNPHKLWEDWMFDETVRNLPKLFLLPLYVGKANNAYERWFIGKHHRLSEISLLGKIGINIMLTIYLHPQDDYSLAERILINDLKPPMNNKVYSLKETEKITLEDPWLD